MKIIELTEKQMDIIFNNIPEWVANNRPEWVANNRPLWMANNIPRWMADIRPRWMADSMEVPSEILDLIRKIK